MGIVRKTRTADGVDIAFESDGSGEPVVLVHGITEDRSSWKTVAELLAVDYQVVRIDLRGHGQSGRGSQYDLRTLASDVERVMLELRVDTAHLVGHSLGGATVSFAAASFAARSVTNIDQSMRLDALVPMIRPIEPALRSADYLQTVHALLSSLEGDQLPEAVRHELANYHGNAKQDVVLGCWELLFRQNPDSIAQMVDETLRTIKVPYWSLHGSNPGTEYESWLKKRVPSAIIELWSGSGHWLHRVDPDRFVASLRKFLGASS